MFSMKIITVGTEQKLFDKGGRVYKRIKEYSEWEEIEKYYCFVFTKDRTKEKIIDNNFIIVPVFYRYKIFFFFSLFWAIRKEKLKNNLENKKNILISSQDPFEIGFVCYLISRFFKYKLLVQVHTDISSKYFRRESVRNYFQFMIAKFVIRHAGSIRVVSNKIKKYLVTDLKIESDKIFVSPVFVGDLSTETSSLFKEDRDEVRGDFLLVLCRLEKVKNIPLAIKSFLELVKDKKYQDYKLKIVGSGSQEKYLKEKFGMHENIIFEKFSDTPFVEYSKAKLFLLTSWYEGWGMTPIESVSCGTPVVMTNVGCAGEFIFDNLNGVVCPTYKVKDFTNSIKQALVNYENFTQEKMQNSLKMLQTKEEYLNTLKKSYEK